MIEAWRLPDPAPESGIERKYCFRKMGFDLWGIPRHRLPDESKTEAPLKSQGNLNFGISMNRPPVNHDSLT